MFLFAFYRVENRPRAEGNQGRNIDYAENGEAETELAAVQVSEVSSDTDSDPSLQPIDDSDMQVGSETKSADETKNDCESSMEAEQSESKRATRTAVGEVPTSASASAAPSVSVLLPARSLEHAHHLFRRLWKLLAHDLMELDVFLFVVASAIAVQVPGLFFIHVLTVLFQHCYFYLTSVLEQSLWISGGKTYWLTLFNSVCFV